jgi:ribonuclease I
MRRKPSLPPMNSISPTCQYSCVMPAAAMAPVSWVVRGAARFQIQKEQFAADGAVALALPGSPSETIAASQRMQME